MEAPKVKPNAYGYARVSTTEQFHSRLSIDEQQRQIQTFCDRQGLDLGSDGSRIGEEAASAYKLHFCQRPLGKRLNAARNNSSNT